MVREVSGTDLLAFTACVYGSVEVAAAGGAGVVAGGVATGGVTGGVTGLGTKGFAVPVTKLQREVKPKRAVKVDPGNDALTPFDEVAVTVRAAPLV